MFPHGAPSGIPCSDGLTTQSSMAYRPTSITLIGWFETLVGLLGIPGLVASRLLKHTSPLLISLQRFHLPASVSFTVSLMGVCATLACGIGLLKGRNWARYLYIGWSLISFIYALVVFQAFMLFLYIPPLVLTLVIIFFLFTPTAKQYFVSKSP